MRTISVRNYLLVALSMLSFTTQSQNIQYAMPEESAQHEGTWLQWPHNHTYPPYYRDDLEPTWLAMTEALITGEKVHIIAYDQTEYDHIVDVLIAEGIPMSNIDFFIHENDDCWIRDNGPVFVYDSAESLIILDWGFNGWGMETPYEKDDLIPELVSADISIQNVDLSAMVLENGAVELDGSGSFLATKSSIINPDRNPGLSQSEIENYLTTYLGVINFIWLDGVMGLELTDMHIDGFARFFDSTTIIAMDSLDLIYWELPATDITTLFNAQNTNGNAYDFVFLPLTQNNVETTWGENLGYKGSYINYYVGNLSVLVPTYVDPNDAVAISLLENLYPTRDVIGIDVRNLYFGGGMVHCVTQQQPVELSTSKTMDAAMNSTMLFQNSPNPFSKKSTVSIFLEKNSSCQLAIYNSMGQKIMTLVNSELQSGNYQFSLDADELGPGIFFYTLTVDDKTVICKKMVVIK